MKRERRERERKERKKIKDEDGFWWVCERVEFATITLDFVTPCASSLSLAPDDIFYGCS